MKIKCCVYLVHEELDFIDITTASNDYQIYLSEKDFHKFCDSGDDPSFYCAEKYKSNVTWGVCRHNVRQGLEYGDEVHFVSCVKKKNKIWEYYYIGYGVVESAITQKDLFINNRYKIFQKYFNTLIRPNDNGFEYFEKLPSQISHQDDWQMRISSVHRWKQLEAFNERTGKYSCGIKTTNKLRNSKVSLQIHPDFPYGENYIIFDKKNSKFNTTNPKYISTVEWDGRSPKTKWVNSKIQKLFGNGYNRESFTNGSMQHTVFNLEKPYSDYLKEIL